MLKKSKIIIISGASGAGKTTLVNHLLMCDELNLVFSVSACTRKKRTSEIQGSHYQFLTESEFKDKINADQFLEWEEVYSGHFYGTLKSNTMSILNSGKNILFDVDIKGANKLKQHFKDRSIGIFIQAPSLEVAEARLVKRGTDSGEKLKMRVEKIKDEIKQGQSMDYQLLNNVLSNSKKELYNLVLSFLNS